MSFFEMLGVAGQERIHTQFLAWILAPQGSPLQDAQRALIVRALIGGGEANQACVHLTPRVVMTEVKHIDLLLVLDGHVVFLENKLKARQSAGQLARYNVAIEEVCAAPGHFGLWEGARIPLRVFLNFSGETNVDGWRDVDYGQLARALRRLPTLDAFVLGYQRFLAKLRGFRARYLRNHRTHSGVARNAGLNGTARLRAASNQQLGELEQFLLMQRLDTVFCEALFFRVAKRLPGQVFHQVGDTRGHALLQSTFFECTIVGAPAGVCFHVGAQLQRGTIKLNISAGDRYAQSSRDWIAPVEAELDTAIGRHWPPALGRYRTNARTLAYRSWSAPLLAPQVLESSSLGDFAHSYAQTLEQARVAWLSALQELELGGWVAQVTAVVPGLQLLDPANNT